MQENMTIPVFQSSTEHTPRQNKSKTNLASWLWPRAIRLLVGLGSISLTARFFTRFSTVFK